jgi:DNA-binding NarL/FixJ family response regulator
MNNLRVAVIDDHPLFRTGVIKTLAELGVEVVAEGGSAAEAVLIAKSHCPAVMLLDISMPGGGLEAVKVVLQQRPDTKIVMLTASEDSEHVRKALQLGACGYAVKGIGSAGLAEILDTVTAGNRYLAPTLSVRMVTEANQGEALSLREREVMELIATGLSNKVVARQLGLHEKTVKHHMTRIFGKLHVSNRTEAALKWQRSRSSS